MNNQKLFMGKNSYFYLNLAFTIIYTILSYFINKYIASTQYIPLGITIFIIITIFLNKMKEHIDENDNSSLLGKTKKELSEKETEIKDFKNLIEDKQAKINSLFISYLKKLFRLQSKNQFININNTRK